MWILGITTLVGISLFLVGTWVWSEFQRTGIQNTGTAQSVTLCGSILSIGGGVMLSLY